MNITRNMVPTVITKREARARLLAAAPGALREYPGGEQCFGESVAAAISVKGAKIVAFGDGSMVVQPYPARGGDSLRFVVS